MIFKWDEFFLQLCFAGVLEKASTRFQAGRKSLVRQDYVSEWHVRFSFSQPREISISHAAHDAESVFQVALPLDGFLYIGLSVCHLALLLSCLFGNRQVGGSSWQPGWLGFPIKVCFTTLAGHFPTHFNFSELALPHHNKVWGVGWFFQRWSSSFCFWDSGHSQKLVHNLHSLNIHFLIHFHDLKNAH